MFSKLKQIKDLRDQAKKIQEILGAEQAHISHKGVDILITGNQEITAITIAPELISLDKKDALERTVKEATNEAIKKIQTVMARKMQEMQKRGDIELPNF